MRLDGSCCCGAVRFSVEAYAPVPYLRCYCSVCRKTAGGGGYAVNLGARAGTLEVQGEESVRTFHAVIDGKQSPAARSFCGSCGSALWLWDPRWPDLLHPFASAIDTDLPAPPGQVHMMLDARPAWARLDTRPGEACFPGFPEQSLEEWHRAHGLLHETRKPPRR
ncbi:GFA family protein [Marinimicrococcus flavescens]|uniref:GFA family protein n=1 Tax=Marinimicrococcus flavescens TaxID=3031815 RepID=A0AAP3XS36_9PROT|nr:GFA family protein [Marinimicrococcus flavescens]